MTIKFNIEDDKRLVLTDSTSGLQGPSLVNISKISGIAEVSENESRQVTELVLPESISSIDDRLFEKFPNIKKIKVKGEFANKFLQVHMAILSNSKHLTNTVNKILYLRGGNCLSRESLLYKNHWMSILQTCLKV